MGADLQQVVDPHPRELRGRPARARRRGALPQRERHPARSRRTDQGHRPRARPDDPRRGDPHLRPVRCRGVRRPREDPDGQRPHRRRASLPDPHRYLHL